MTPAGRNEPTLLHRFFDWLDDRSIRRTVRERDTVDTGERWSLDEVIERVLAENGDALRRLAEDD